MRSHQTAVGIKRKPKQQAIQALTKLGIPLQRDSNGVVRWIEATKGEFSDEAMRYLAKLPSLEWLEIGEGSVNSGRHRTIEGLHALRRLYLHDINLSGDGLAWLSGLTKLEALSLQRTGLTASRSRI